METKKFIIDARMIGPRGHGIALYVEELAKGLKNHLAGLAQQNYEIHFLVAPDCPRDANVRSFSCTETSIPFLGPSELWKLPKLLLKLNANFYLSPSFSSLLNYPCPHALILHDLNHLHFGSIAQKIYYKCIVKRAAKSAVQVFGVSHTTRKEVAKWLGLPETKIAFAPNVIALEVPPKISLHGFDLNPEKYFIAIGNAKEHKNLALLLRAYALYRAENKNPWPLVLPLDAEELDGPKHGVHFLSTMNYATLMSLLAQSGGLLMPSAYEGFSRPPVEASLLQVPCVVSDIVVHREVLESVPEAKFIPADSTESWAMAFTDLQNQRIARPSVSSVSSLRERYQSRALLEPILKLVEKTAND